MAEIRSLKLALLADTTDFIQGLNKADKEAKTFSSKLGNALKTGAMAFAALGAAAGAAAIKIGVDSVKAAIEDDKAQRNLAKTLENVIGATKAQTKAVEEYITQQSISLGVSDDLLRPAYARLIRSTKNTAEAQKALNIALDISSATGKDLDSVTTALGKAYDGNSVSLAKLGLGIDKAILKTGDMDLITKTLAETFRGFAEQEANTVEGRFRRISIAINEAKETLGYALLPLLEKFAKFATDTLVPAVNDFVAGLTGGDPNSVVNATRDVRGRVDEMRESLNKATGNDASGAYGLGIAMSQLAGTINDFGAALMGANGDLTLKDFVVQMTNLLKVVNAMIKPFVALVELSQAFRKSQSGARITIPDWIKNFDASVPDFLKTPAQRSSSTSSTGGVSITINSALSDPNAIARAVTNALNTSGRYGTVRVV